MAESTVAKILSRRRGVRCPHRGPAAPLELLVVNVQNSIQVSIGASRGSFLEPAPRPYRT